LRAAVDTGGTFTDLLLDDGEGALRQFKAPTTPEDPLQGVLDVLDVAADALGISRRGLLARLTGFLHGTTRPINAVLTGTTAPTALIVTHGHPDILVLREGGRLDPFDHSRAYPSPYVPRRLTFEVRERVDHAGRVVQELDEDSLEAAVLAVQTSGVLAVAVCLLWSISNPDHERRVGRRLAERLPEVAVTLSHELIPIAREYRRASAAAIDASLKPLMGDYFTRLQATLGDHGFTGRVLVVTSGGGVLDAADVVAAPIHAIGSGPAMAPVAGRLYAREDAQADTAVVADAGGTSYEVSLIRRGEIPWTKETWIGRPFEGHMTGFPSVDVKSIGAGGGSIAQVDEGGMLTVGPASAGADPGPACYGRGGSLATFTDAAVLLGYIDPEYFLGGTIKLDVERARRAVTEQVAEPLGLELADAAAAIITIGTERMVSAIEAITIDQGIQPESAVLIAGGGAAGLNSVAIARRLGIRQVVFPDTGATLNAAGALLSDLLIDRRTAVWASSVDFDYAAVNDALRRVEGPCRDFIESHRRESTGSRLEFFAECRYPNQIWELEVPLASPPVTEAEGVDGLVSAFHEIHHELFAVADVSSPVELTGVRCRAICGLRRTSATRVVRPEGGARSGGKRDLYFAGAGLYTAQVLRAGDLKAGEMITGPGVVESPVTSVILDPWSTATVTATGSLLVSPQPRIPGLGAERSEEAVRP
jgi:N-methylhydantoinase A